MNEGKLINSLDESIRLLRKVDLVRNVSEKNRKIVSCKKFSESFRRIALKDNYVHIFRTGLEHKDYDILLNDYSYFQFSYEPDNKVIRMCYYPNPYKIKTYFDYLVKVIGFEESEIDEWDNSFEEDFEHYLVEEKPTSNIYPIRYDYNESCYDSDKPLKHHVSHLHIGISNDIRIGADIELTPLSFTCLVINWFHLSCWKRNMETIEEIINELKNKIECVNEGFFSELEKKYLYMH